MSRRMLYIRSTLLNIIIYYYFRVYKTSFMVVCARFGFDYCSNHMALMWTKKEERVSTAAATTITTTIIQMISDLHAKRL